MIRGKNSAPDATHEELQTAVIACDAMLRACWATHGADDMIVLGDVRRPELAMMAGWEHGEAVVARVLREAEATGVRPWMAFKQNCGPFIDGMANDGDPSHKLAAGELRGFRSLRPLGFVPLLVVVPGGHWATFWSDRPGVIAFRYDPETGKGIMPPITVTGE